MPLLSEKNKWFFNCCLTYVVLILSKNLGSSQRLYISEAEYSTHTHCENFPHFEAEQENIRLLLF